MARKMSAAERRALHGALASGAAPAAAGTAQPTVGQAYRLQLGSAHFGAPSGGYLDAHRSDKKDTRDALATFASVHYADVADGALAEQAGTWLMEAVTEWRMEQSGRAPCFRLKLLSSHYECPAGMYLCAVPPNLVPAAPKKSRLSSVTASSSAKVVKRNADSTWCVVQPLASCDASTGSVWTLEPGEEQGQWQIRLVTKRGGGGKDEGPPRAFLEVHGSGKQDKRNDYSHYVNLHNEYPGCVGEWQFHVVEGRSGREESNEEESSEEESIEHDTSDDLTNVGRSLLRAFITAPAASREPGAKGYGAQSEESSEEESSSDEESSDEEDSEEGKETIGRLNANDVAAMMNGDSNIDAT
jgi:hypothetical protein